MAAKNRLTEKTVAEVGSPDAAQRVALREAVRCRAGAVTNAGV